MFLEELCRVFDGFTVTGEQMSQSSLCHFKFGWRLYGNKVSSITYLKDKVLTSNAECLYIYNNLCSMAYMESRKTSTIWAWFACSGAQGILSHTAAEVCTASSQQHFQATFHTTCNITACVTSDLDWAGKSDRLIVRPAGPLVQWFVRMLPTVNPDRHSNNMHA